MSRKLHLQEQREAKRERERKRARGGWGRDAHKFNLTLVSMYACTTRNAPKKKVIGLSSVR